MNIDLRVGDFSRVVFFTGAGLSKASGIPTYRGKGGIWKEYDYTTHACQRAFDRDPEGVWEFHNFRRDMVSRCAPNRGHELIANVQQQNANAAVVTQNIDGLHQAAGSHGVIELHGSLWRVRCDACGHKSEGRESPLAELRCQCGAYLRPDIVWFEDSLDMDVISAALDAISTCDLLLSIGTSAVVFPAAEMPIRAKQNGATLVEINPEPTPLTPIYDRSYRATAVEVLEVMCGE